MGLEWAVFYCWGFLQQFQGYLSSTGKSHPFLCNEGMGTQDLGGLSADSTEKTPKGERQALIRRSKECRDLGGDKLVRPVFFKTEDRKYPTCTLILFHITESCCCPPWPMPFSKIFWLNIWTKFLYPWLLGWRRASSVSYDSQQPQGCVFNHSNSMIFCSSQRF